MKTLTKTLIATAILATSSATFADGFWNNDADTRWNGNTYGDGYGRGDGSADMDSEFSFSMNFKGRGNGRADSNVDSSWAGRNDFDGRGYGYNYYDQPRSGYPTYYYTPAH